MMLEVLTYVMLALYVIPAILKLLGIYLVPVLTFLHDKTYQDFEILDHEIEGENHHIVQIKIPLSSLSNPVRIEKNRW